MSSVSKKDGPNAVWQDREIRFDVRLKDLNLRKGEFEIDHLQGVEDTKGNTGDKGELVVTNLRTIWVSSKRRNINLSIGYGAMVSINTRTANTRLRGQTQSLYIMTKFNGSRFEFIFTNLVSNSPRLFTTIQAVQRAYDASKMYRDLKLRGAIIADKELKLLPKEEVYNKVNGVWNLSSEQGNLGTFFITNVRVVWHANMAENFNVSIPYIQMKSVSVRDSKFGQALVVHTTHRSGGYILGFRVDPAEKLKEVFTEIEGLHKVFSANPIFGVDFSVEERAGSLSSVSVPRETDDVEIVNDGEAFKAYYAFGGEPGEKREVVFCPELGLAIEKLPEGVTIEQLWNIV